MEFIVAIDGPAGSGKSTVAKNVAKRLEFTYLDTGAMYRAISLKFLKNGINYSNSEELIRELEDTEIDINMGMIYIDGEDVTAEIRKREVTAEVSKVAAIREVRKSMVEKQREIAKGKRIIMDGRDIGTVVFPDADVKVFLIATPQERARRRVKDYERLGQKVEFEEILKEINKRDKEDSEREESPLVKAQDAVEIDTTIMGIEDVENIICELIEKKMIDKIIK